MPVTFLDGLNVGNGKMGNIDFAKAVSTDIYQKSISDDLGEFSQMLSEAKSELNFYDWCLGIVDSYVGIFFAGVVGVFLFKVKPASEDIDEWLWVVVGDLPPLYLTCEDCPNAACALDAYIGAMQEWIEAAESGASISELVPVNVPATPENAQILKSRLTMLDERVLSQYQEDLKA